MERYLANINFHVWADSEYCTVLHLCGQTTHEFIEFNDGRI